MKLLMINQPLNNRGDESAHRALVRRVLSEMPNVSLKVLFIGEKSDSVRQFQVKDDRVTYVSYLSQSCTKNKILYFLYDRLILGNLFFKYLNKCYEKRFTWLWWLNPLFWPLFLKIYRADAILNAPGGICMGGFQVWQHIAYLKIAKILKKDIYYYGRSIGPFPEETISNKRFKESSYELLRYFRFLSLRDSKSEEIAKGLAINYVPTVDSAFLDIPANGIPQTIVQSIGSNYIVFVPNVLRWHYMYKEIPQNRIDKMYLDMISLIHKSYPTSKIVMLPQTFNYDLPLWNDVNYFRTLSSLLGNPPYLTVVDDIYSSDIQQQIIAKAKLIVGARYHSIVFGINNSTPFISLSYEHKMDGLLTTLGCSNRMIDIRDLISDTKIKDIVDRFAIKLEETMECTKYHAKAVDIADSCFAKLKLLINNDFSG